jgi:hypothetical protein
MSRKNSSSVRYEGRWIWRFASSPISALERFWVLSAAAAVVVVQPS